MKDSYRKFSTKSKNTDDKTLTQLNNFKSKDSCFEEPDSSNIVKTSSTSRNIQCVRFVCNRYLIDLKTKRKKKCRLGSQR
ncbi:hypothetical protein DERP_013978 [Dermatophagoides pteronyssinus]|uniref:Uncharacterized protein n=1 Tax=Dermatophagoides pteronyssinus TaxID=6956 RepID=A0ABQ8IRP1_DERPT|nr:hypothetical protein DERP_013978 [Dermatophagoides pteronyssinus]